MSEIPWTQHHGRIDGRGWMETQTADGFTVRKYEPDEMNLVEIVIYPPRWHLKQVVTEEMLLMKDYEKALIQNSIGNLKFYIEQRVT